MILSDDRKGSNGLWICTYTSGGQRGITRSARYWGSMNTRCKPPKSRAAKFPTYNGCSMSDNFNSFQYFSSWCQGQVGYGLDGATLDKDILVKGNKTYSEDLCAFVPNAVNVLFTKRTMHRGAYPVGVHQVTANHSKGRFTYAATCSVDGKLEYIGTFSSVEDAFFAYKAFKEGNISRIADKYIDVLDSRVYLAMKNYTVEITD